MRTYYSEVALPAMERGDEWHWTLRLKTEPERVIGSIGLMRGKTLCGEDVGPLNRGFWIAPEWEGQGLMTEAVIAANDFWFDELGFAVLRTAKAVENAGSRRISEKMGMRVVGTGLERVCLGTVSIGDVGDYGGRVAGLAGTIAPAGISAEVIRRGGCWRGWSGRRGLRAGLRRASRWRPGQQG